jgi:hypothetical protein
MTGNSGKSRRVTPEGEPLEDTGGSDGFPGGGSGGVSFAEFPGLESERDQGRSLRYSFLRRLASS